MTTAQFQILCTGNGRVKRQAETLMGLAQNGALQQGHPRIRPGKRIREMVQNGAK
jgi:hypothetical protein